MDTGATELRRRHQMVLLEMLKEFDRICRRHDIPYMLFCPERRWALSGTAALFPGMTILT